MIQITPTTWASGPVTSTPVASSPSAGFDRGSAAGSLGAYLVHHGKLKEGKRLEILQGVEMGRPSHITVQVHSDRGKLVPRVSGSAVRMLEGIIEA